MHNSLNDYSQYDKSKLAHLPVFRQFEFQSKPSQLHAHTYDGADSNGESIVHFTLL